MATRRRNFPGFPWWQVAAYGGLLALGTAALQWLDYQRIARTTPGDIYVALIAGGFLMLGVVVGIRLVRPAPTEFDGNPAALITLGISPRELEVLQSLARGLSNKEIARALTVSPNTVKTHVARLFAKLEASNRAHAIARARALGILP